ncbi:LacI family DNA-binding transcriptional regulator [Arthrobacter sp. BE255]|uniref:LacI family DNA-binding transcriptional regulator n=1 Tax=Arthrobacter sp. BE255 TaxID=2817721 RepID=UPI002866EEC1|nr:LacI family DNA-binding transcriptional regulator [Arthrobacter sp. BE255]MDR7159161.1 LacI family transcriptional regulator [Arthrobacter sp. BE255]
MADTKRVTLADVARLAGLSPTAVSQILNGRTDARLSAEAHEKALTAAAKLGYRPNMAARSLRTAKTSSLALISDLVATTRFANGLIRGVLEAAQRVQHVVMVLETGGLPAREIQAIDAALDREVDGIIFASARSRELYIPDFPSAKPVVLLNATSLSHSTHILPDEQAGGRKAADVLLDAGHHRGIALIGHNEDVEQGTFRSETIARRIRGIREAMAVRKARFTVEASIWEWEPEAGYRTVFALLEQRKDITALLCLNDRLAFGAYQAISDHGLSVPADISVVSFDNDELASYLRPGLTTVGLPHERMGEKAIELILGKPDGLEHLMEMPLILRNSVAPPAA